MLFQYLERFLQFSVVKYPPDGCSRRLFTPLRCPGTTDRILVSSEILFRDDQTGCWLNRKSNRIRGERPKVGPADATREGDIYISIIKACAGRHNAQNMKTLR